jgi:glycosyltransferase involved in cell wall biosynthesis
MKRESSPRVLCISPFFAPIANAEAFCGGKTALSLLDANVELKVFSVDYSGHPKFSIDPSLLWQRLESVTDSTPPDAKKPKFLSGPLAIRYLSPEWSRWISAIVAKAKRLHREMPFDLIYSRSLPNIAHIAAFWVARAINRPWVANFNDPWDLEGAHLLPQDREKRRRTPKLIISDAWLKRIMRTADALTFPCSRLKDYHLRLAPVGGKCVVIPHIGHACDFKENSPLFQLVHAGSLGSGESTRRDSSVNLLRALRSFLGQQPEARKHFRLVLVGPEDRPTLALAQELGLNDIVSCTGRVSYAESLKWMRRATVCLLVEGEMPEGIFLPSKFPDYIQSDRPVIALSPRNGTIADLAQFSGVTRVSVHETEEIESAISKHYKGFETGLLESLKPSRELKERYDGITVGKQLRELFIAVSSR